MAASLLQSRTDLEVINVLGGMSAWNAASYPTTRRDLTVDYAPTVTLDLPPGWAARALDVDRGVGLLLPCDVTVRADGDGRTIVDALEAQVIAEVPGEPGLGQVTGEAGIRIRAALAELAS